MATVQGCSLSIAAGAGTVSATAFYDDVTGRPVRIEWANTTGRAYVLRLRTADGARQAQVTVPAGSGTLLVPNSVALRVDMRRYGDEPGELPGETLLPWVCELASP